MKKVRALNNCWGQLPIQSILRYFKSKKRNFKSTLRCVVASLSLIITDFIVLFIILIVQMFTKQK